ncbi:hypothetical protein D9M72_255770 [compost metagenome]
MRVQDAQAGADRGPERHHGGGSEVLQPKRQHGVVIGVGEHLEPAVNQLLGGIHQLHGVRQQGVFVGDHFKLHPVSLQRLPRQFRRHHGVPCGEATGGVGQDPDVVVHQELEERACFGRRVAAHGHGGQFRSGRDQGGPQPIEAGGTAGTHDQP